MWRLTVALILVVLLWLISPLPAVAQTLGEYFEISYEPVGFSQNEIHGSEAFQATILGRATCIKDMPVAISEVSINSRVVAEHVASGTEVTLNSSYTVTVKPFPAKAGETAEVNQVIPLQFPAEAESGEYNVIGKLIGLKFKIGFAWFDVTEYITQDLYIGSLKYTAPEPTPTPESTPTTAPTPASPPTETPTPTPAPPEAVIPWWVWLIVAIAVATIAVNVVLLLRHRGT